MRWKERARFGLFIGAGRGCGRVFETRSLPLGLGLIHGSCSRSVGW